MDLLNKVVIVTGGASGLGQATVEAAVEKGAKVAIFDRDWDRAQQLVSELKGDVIAVNVDVTDSGAIKQGIGEVVAQFGGIHVLVNCAGIGMAGRTVGRKGPLDMAIFSKVLEINLMGTFDVLRQCAECMAENEPVTADGERGVIINTASVAAYDGQIGQAAYSASKAGVVGMTLPIARDLRGFGIRVMTIAPGIFETPMMSMAPDKTKQPLIDMTQFPHRLGVAVEYAGLAVHIVENSYLNGECIRLDAGIRMQPK
ncbi:MAG: 3-hydroxyacyl-CoA dehydrogenase [Gammaproteobacteria bacterium]|nr:MAG: 3-hydroxyacyl-CoA dehydrogenase [Gammaproteobacteria bacterium]